MLWGWVSELGGEMGVGRGGGGQGFTFGLLLEEFLAGAGAAGGFGGHCCCGGLFCFRGLFGAWWVGCGDVGGIRGGKVMRQMERGAI